VKKVVILRGVSGSGKSTWAKAQAAKVRRSLVVSADDYFLKPERNGTLRYTFDFSRLTDAHDACLRHFADAMATGVPLVIVDNTNTTVAELAPYVALALAYGYDTELRTFTTPFEVAAARNVHGVSVSACEQQANRMRYAIIPPFWSRVRFVEGDTPLALDTFNPAS
jgi:predicted kinase